MMPIWSKYNKSQMVMLLLYCKRLFYVIYIQPQIIGYIIGDSEGKIVITIQQSLVLFCVYNKRVCEDYQVWLYNYDKRKYMAKYVTISLLYFGHVRYMTNCMATILIAVWAAFPVQTLEPVAVADGGRAI